MIVNISAADVAAVLLLKQIHLSAGETAEEKAQLRMSKVDKQHVSSICCVKLIFSKNSIIQSNSSRLVDKSSHV